MALVFEKRKAVSVMLSWLAGDRRHLSTLSSVQVSGRVLGLRGNRYAEALVGRFYLEDLGAWPFMVKGLQHRIFLDSRPLAPERVLVFKFQSRPVVWFCDGGGGETFGLLSLQSNSVSC